MPSKEDVAKIRKDLWQICAEVPETWNLCIPFSACKFRPRAASDPIFRPEDFEGKQKGHGLQRRRSTRPRWAGPPSVPSPKSLEFRCVQNGSSARREEGAYLDRYVTDEQRSSRPIFNATLRAAASWLFFRPAAAGLARPV